jgi:hypothetical protein
LVSSTESFAFIGCFSIPFVPTFASATATPVATSTSNLTLTARSSSPPTPSASPVPTQTWSRIDGPGQRRRNRNQFDMFSPGLGVWAIALIIVVTVGVASVWRRVPVLRHRESSGEQVIKLNVRTRLQLFPQRVSKEQRSVLIDVVEIY